ncbi:hypothetical protein ACFVWX_13645 [Streptomyces sp. NPDC058220]|uniref:hypothetical protein n=1 Tax=Streptomyces sp. NPDC058220 TaxID=3346387 RepID=UPI0036E69F83
MSPERLAEIAARCDAATAGPWCTDAWEIYRGAEYVPGISEWIGETCRGTSTLEQDRADATFVAAARTDVPEMAAEVERLRARVAELEAAQAPAVGLEPAPLPHHPEHDAIKRTAQTRGRLTITPPVSPYWTTADYAHETEALRTLVWPVVRKALAEEFPGFSAAFTADDIDICVHCRSEFEFATDAEAADPSTRTDEHSVGGEPVCCKAAMDAFRAARRLPEADL